MQWKTHLAIGVGLAFYFLPYVTYKGYFFPIVLLASLLPDIDLHTSALGERKVFRPLQAFTRHRGAFHSYTFCLLLTLPLALWWPVFALPFFLGYSFHLLADSFTVKGIRPFWPLKMESAGIVKSGGVVDRSIFYVFVLVDIFLFLLLFV